jgi:transcription termination factor NusB
MEYDEMLPYYYNNNQQFLQERLDSKVIRDTKIFEKTQIKWFTFDDIKKHHNEFRSFYKDIVKLILDDKTEIEGFIRKAFNKKGLKKKGSNKLGTRKNRK